MALQETGKRRASRIPLDYYKQAEPFGTWKFRLSLLALALSVLYVASTFALGNRGQDRFSHGPVHAVHQSFENRCEACHVAFQPIKQDSILTPFVNKPLTSDDLCMNCHAGPAHSDKQLPSEVVSCGTCHRDHRGREVSLVNLPDRDCTVCHEDLKKHQKPGSEVRFKDVKSFSLAGHPPFASPSSRKAGTASIQFNHQLHMAPGLTLQQTLATLRDPVERERYRKSQPQGKQADMDLVQLTCASCHQLDSRDGQPARGTVARSAGDLMLPVLYETSCKACHPLTFDKDIAEPIPHGLQPKQVHSYLWGALASKTVRDPERKVEENKPIPGKSLGDPDENRKKAIDQDVKKKEDFLYQKELDIKERFIFSGKTTCGECHRTNNETPKEIKVNHEGDPWLPHARFNHSSHRAMRCEDCHQTDPSTQSKDMTMPGIDNCVQCHGPATTVNGKPQGGVRFGCTECHAYHHGEQPLQGKGSIARDAVKKQTIESFLSGKNLLTK